MLKYLLIGLVLFILVYLPIKKRLTQTRKTTRDNSEPQRDAGVDSKPPSAPENMVACDHCGLHLPAGEAHRDAGRYYCSETHAVPGHRHTDANLHEVR